MNATTQTKQPEVAKVVSRVIADEKKLTPENRSDHREPLVIPAQIHQEKFELTLNGFVRNISTGGVCLIVPQPFRQGDQATVSLLGQTTKVESAATCCWGTKFGTSYWISGWKLDKQLPVARMLKEDGKVEPEQRTGKRLTTAIPVYVKLPNSSARASCFTRNLSRDGISLVGKLETAPGQLATLEITHVDGKSDEVASRCLWAKRYGEDHWVSGWDFNV